MTAQTPRRREGRILPRFFRSRLRAAALFGTEEDAATLRWRAHNAARPQVCLCGQPGTVDRPSTYPAVGRVRPRFWYCEEHKDVPETTPWFGGRPMIGQTREQCNWTHTAPGGIVSECGCGTHVGEPHV